MKELRISATITVPDNVIEQAKMIASAAPFIEKFRAELEDACGTACVTVEYELVQPKPRAPAADAARGHSAEMAAAKEIPGVKSHRPAAVGA